MTANILIFLAFAGVGGALSWISYQAGKRDGIRLGRIDEQIYIAKQHRKLQQERK